MNETLQTIRSAQKKHEEQEHFVTLVSFNSDGIKAIYDKIEADKVTEITDDDYCPACCTTLYDAMGVSLTKLRKRIAEDDVVLVTIITDGYENASREYNGQAIKSLVESLKAKGWVFTYIGANQDVEKVAASISINNTLSFSADVKGTKAMLAKESSLRDRFFTRLHCGMKGKLSDNYFDNND